MLQDKIQKLYWMKILCLQMIKMKFNKKIQKQYKQITMSYQTFYTRKKWRLIKRTFRKKCKLIKSWWQIMETNEFLSNTQTVLLAKDIYFTFICFFVRIGKQPLNLHQQLKNWKRRDHIAQKKGCIEKLHIFFFSHIIINRNIIFKIIFNRILM